MVAPDGWTQLSAPIAGAVSWIKRATSVEPANYTFTWTGASVSCGSIAQFSGVSFAAIDGNGATANGAGTNIIAPTLTPKWTADLLVNCYVDIGANTITVPGGQTPAGSSVGNSRSIIWGYETLASNSATGTRTATAASATSYGFSFLLREPSVSGLMVPYAPFSVLGPMHDAAPNAAIYGTGPNNAAWAAGILFAGLYKVEGHCKLIGPGTPLYRHVLLTTMEGQPVRGAMTVNTDGSYSFPYLPAGKYILLGIDQTLNQNAVVAALIDAIAM